MTYPSQSTIRSYSGASVPSYLTTTLPASYSAGQTFTLASASTWYEVSATGQATTNPLGTSGPFVLVVDFSTATEEKVLCSSVNVSTGVVTVWTDGTANGRGYDGTTIQAHSVGSTPNCFPVATAVENLQLNAGVVSALANAATAQSTANTALTNAATAQSTANTAEADAQTGIANAATAQATANAKVASVTAGDSTITIAGTSTAPTVKVTANTFDPYGAASSKVASVTAGDNSITIGGTATAPTVAVAQANLVIGESQVTNLTNDLAAKALKTTTISTTAPLTGGGDLSANRTLAINAASTTQSGAVQLTDSVSTTSSTLAATATAVKSANDNASAKVASVTASTGITVAGTATAPTVAISTLSPSPAGTYGSATLVPAVTVNAQGQVTSVATNTVNDSTKLPLAGGIMTGGSINMNSVSRITNLQGPATTAEPLRAGDIPTAGIPPSLHGLTAWTFDPAVAAGGTLTLVSGVAYFSAIYIPYTMTISKVWGFVNTGGVPATTGTVLNLGLYNSTTLLASTGNQSAFIGVTGAAGFSLTSPYTIATPGVYWIGLLYVTGTGGTPSAPTWTKTANTINTQINFNVANSGTSLLNQRSASVTGRSSLPTDLTALTTINFNQNFMFSAVS